MGNKVDLATEREVTWQTANTYVSNSLPNGNYIETSAKYNLNVSEVFNDLLARTFGINKEEVSLFMF